MSSNQNKSAGSARRTERGGVRAVGVGRFSVGSDSGAQDYEQQRDQELIDTFNELYGQSEHD
jgi:hypothetical protein